MPERLLLTAEHDGRGQSVVALLIQLALAYQQCGDQPRGLEALDRALKVAEPEGYARLFADEGEPMLPLLRRTLSTGTSTVYVTRLLRAFHVGDHTAPLTEIMTPRERDVLRLLALGLSNRSIAEQLVTSEATAKSHGHRLIGKLGVSSRAQVVVRAREIGVLDAPVSASQS